MGDRMILTLKEGINNIAIEILHNNKVYTGCITEEPITEEVQ